MERENAATSDARGNDGPLNEHSIDLETLASRLRVVSELTADCCWMRLEHPDGSREREWITGSVERLTGYTPAEFAELGLQKLVHPDDLPFALDRVMAPEGLSEHEFRIITKTGQVRWLEERMRTEQREDGMLVAFGATRDITVQKKAETAFRETRDQQQQSQKMEALGMLAGGVAHDFNNLLTVMIGYGELVLMDGELKPELVEGVKEMRLAAERAAELTRQLLTFSRKHPMVARVTDVNALISDTTKMLRRLVPSHMDLVALLDPDLPGVSLDSGQFEQVLVNLVVNARDALEGPGQIEIETRRVRPDRYGGRGYVHDPAGEHVLVRVSDNGCGIDSEALPRIFEPFYTSKTSGKGTGLGLAAVYGTVTQSGGWIGVESQLGVGTSFLVFLPAASDPVESNMPSPDRAPSNARGTESILLVEDEHRVRLFLARALSRLGYRVIEASRPADAVKMCADPGQEIHLLLTDMVMPEMNGQELATAPRLVHVWVSGGGPGPRELARHER
jgi:two-component system cell cycle sensor histidine kinase/response regulator CckA